MKALWASRLDGSPDDYSPDHRRGEISHAHSDQVREMKSLLGRVGHVSLLSNEDNFAPEVIGPHLKDIEPLWPHFAEKSIQAAIHSYLELEDVVITKIIQLGRTISGVCQQHHPIDLDLPKVREIISRARASLEHQTQCYKTLEYAIEICAAWSKLSDSHGFAPLDLIAQLRRATTDPQAYNTWLEAARHMPHQPAPHRHQKTSGHTLKDPHISNSPPSDAPQLKATPLDWQVLPPDWFRRSGPREFGHKHLNEERLDRIQELEKYRPDRWYEGSHLGEHAYFVADFGSIVVADSPDLGNALYYLVTPQAEKWKQIFQLHKKEALNRGARRIVHTNKTWQSKLAQVMRVFRS